MQFQRWRVVKEGRLFQSWMQTAPVWIFSTFFPSPATTADTFPAISPQVEGEEENFFFAFVVAVKSNP